MTTPTTHTTRLDKCPPGLVHVAAHDWCEGGLAYKHPSGRVWPVDNPDTDWIIQARDTPDFEGVPLTCVPTETAAADASGSRQVSRVEGSAMTHIDEIRDRLGKARPGLAEIDGGEELQKRRGNPKGLYSWTLYGTYADAILLVHAHDDIRWLLDAVARRDARCEDLAVQLDAIRAVLDAIRAVLGEEPDPCPEHPDDDPVTCGWKRDILTIRHILNDTTEN